MKRRQFMRTGLGLGACAMTSRVNASKRLHWRESVFAGLGTVLSIRAAHVDADGLESALRKARDVIAHVDDEMSLFRPNSALNRLNHSGVLHQPSAEMLSVLQMSQQIAKRSHGAFDVTVQPLWQLYARAQKEGRLPSVKEVAGVQQCVGWQRLHITPTKIKLMHPSMGISLNGIAQGYATDLVKASLRSDGVSHALINAGEWSAIGLADAERPWILGIADPHRANAWLTRVEMNGLSIATSADDQCAFSADRKHHHIFNPHTGYSPQDISSATVAAPSCALADALTKVLFVAGYEHALHIAQAWQVSALVVNKQGEWKASANFPRVTA